RKKHEGLLLDEDLASHIKQAKVVTTVPSTLAQPSVYKSLQAKLSERILDDRPEEDCSISPVSLLYNRFSEFLDIFAGATDVEGLNNVDALQHHLAVKGFVQSMCKFFKDENERKKDGLKLLNKIFSKRKDNLYSKLTVVSIGSTLLDGHYIGLHNMATIIGKF
ncbi:hypothetical protein AX16_000668, partial [Volvariella volvacea WC 439]